ncbi:hypothetical protein BDA99DRAFT_556793 [Phascolomyces articulosus]|uniref:RRM domain-containing protein n=1 Tax=Phascolomyces articulosus TaxID=60185 RepID=A0AAD5K687_9FUNG|nr:hypothetical protein BDA99DRAFT_556793 [Phascolomyces articulosus]
MWFAKVYDPLQAGSIDGIDTIIHDNAVKRAQHAHYHPPKNETSDPAKTIFVARLNFDTTEESLQSYFKQFGEITHIRLIYNLVTGTSQGYGFITYKHEHHARTAYDKANHAVLDSHVILVDYERSRMMKGWIPRRLGGGFGGKKESGQLRFGARDKPFRKPINDSSLHISHDQRRSDNWRFPSSSASSTSHENDHRYHRRRSASPRPRSSKTPSSSSRKKSSSRERRKSKSPPRKRKRSISRHRRDYDDGSSSRTYHRSPSRRYHSSRDDRSPRRYYHSEDRSRRSYHREDRSPRRRHR